jgi:hypothetical protein
MIETVIPTVSATLAAFAAPPALTAPAAVASGVAAQQPTATGGSVALALAVLLGLAVAAGLSLLIAYEAVRGYRGTGDRAMLWLAAGIVLLTAGPIALRVAIPTFTTAGDSVRILSATTSELLGLGCILYAIYGRP